ncbi:MAG TPA: hypothetical protein VLF40_04030 [Candidatus Saccharimonadales bacterium]|nr:hypothetical protein [Candidatus Saccharimonadales bacterium]
MNTPELTPGLIGELGKYGVVSGRGPEDGFCCAIIGVLGRLPLNIEASDGNFDDAWEKLLEVADQILTGQVPPDAHLRPRATRSSGRKVVDIITVPDE